MIVRCRSTALTEQQKEAMGATPALGFSYNLIEGHIYRVLGITFASGSNIFGSTVLFDIVDETDCLMPIPGCLFEVVDSRVSAHWEGKFQSDGAFALWPAPFWADYFHDLLSEGDPKAKETLARVIRLLTEEDC